LGYSNIELKNQRVSSNEEWIRLRIFLTNFYELEENLKMEKMKEKK